MAIVWIRQTSDKISLTTVQVLIRMSSAIAILTYNRLPALKRLFQSVAQLSATKKIPIAVFDDCGQEDDTRKWLSTTINPPEDRPELAAVCHSIGIRTDSFLGTENLGVAGNSNRALKWFMESTTADHLMLCNDDIEFLGDATELYAKTHAATGIDLLCFCDFTSPQYKCVPVVYRGINLKKLIRMTGMMMSITRKLVESIGYFDPQFGQFGEDHCDYTIRARFAGNQDIHGIMQYCLDVEQPTPPLLRHQDVPSTINAAQKPELDRIASGIMAKKSSKYAFTNPYLGFTLRRNSQVDAVNESGIDVDHLPLHSHLAI